MSPETFVISLLLICGGLLSSGGAQDSGHVGKFVNTKISLGLFVIYNIFCQHTGNIVP